MNNGNERRRRKRSGKRYRLRYDRVIAAVLVLIVMIVVLSSCMKSCSKSKKGSDGSGSSSTSTPQSSIEDNLQSGMQQGVIVNTPTGTMTTGGVQFTTEVLNSSSIYTGDLILVNSNTEYKFTLDQPNPIAISGNSDSQHFIAKDLVTKLGAEPLKALDDLMSGFYQATSNNDIVIIGGYRTFEEQNDKYLSGSSGFKGGYSDYHTGRSFDMAIFPKDGTSSGYYSPTGIYSWIDENAADYGFVLRFPEGKETYTGERGRTQTYRYVGAAHANYMKANGLCLEEYIQLLKEHPKDKPIQINTKANMYNVYYVPAVPNANTEVPVPANQPYKISGNNVDGYIVTVTMVSGN